MHCSVNGKFESCELSCKIHWDSMMLTAGSQQQVCDGFITKGIAAARPTKDYVVFPRTRWRVINLLL